MKKYLMIFLTIILVTLMASACSGSAALPGMVESNAQTTSVEQTTAQEGTTILTQEESSQESTTANTSLTADSESGANTAAETGAKSVSVAMAQNSDIHLDGDDLVWENSSIVPIVLNGDSIGVNSDGVTVNGSTATIT